MLSIVKLLRVFVLLYHVSYQTRRVFNTGVNKMFVYFRIAETNIEMTETGKSQFFFRKITKSIRPIYAIYAVISVIVTYDTAISFCSFLHHISVQTKLSV